MVAKTKKSTKGCVGYICDGCIKQGKFIFAFCESDDPNELRDNLVKSYGSGITYNYVNCEEPEDVFNKFKK